MIRSLFLWSFWGVSRSFRLNQASKVATVEPVAGVADILQELVLTHFFRRKIRRISEGPVLFDFIWRLHDLLENRADLMDCGSDGDMFFWGKIMENPLSMGLIHGGKRQCSSCTLDSKVFCQTPS